MARITFQKRQKEMKRIEKQRMKVEKRAQRKLEKNAASQPPTLEPGPKLLEVRPVEEPEGDDVDSGNSRHCN